MTQTAESAVNFSRKLSLEKCNTELKADSVQQLYYCLRRRHWKRLPVTVMVNVGSGRPDGESSSSL